MENKVLRTEIEEQMHDFMKDIFFGANGVSEENLKKERFITSSIFKRSEGITTDTVRTIGMHFLNSRAIHNEQLAKFVNQAGHYGDLEIHCGDDAGDDEFTYGHFTIFKDMPRKGKMVLLAEFVNINDSEYKMIVLDNEKDYKDFVTIIMYNALLIPYGIDKVVMDVPSIDDMNKRVTVYEQHGLKYKVAVAPNMDEECKFISYEEKSEVVRKYLEDILEPRARKSDDEEFDVNINDFSEDEEGFCNFD